MSNHPHLRPRRRRWAVASATAAAVAISPLGIPAPAHAAGDGQVTVQVRDLRTSIPIAGQSVSLWSTATGGAVGSAKTTDPGGWVVFNGLDNGGYTAKVAGSTAYYEKYSTVVLLTADHDYEYANVSLVPAQVTFGKLTGTVKQAGVYELDARIEIFPASATQASIESGSVSPAAMSSAYDYAYDRGDRTDDWTANLPAGQYKVRVSDRNSGTTCHGTYDPDDYDDYCDGWRGPTSFIWAGNTGTNDFDHAKAFGVAARKSTSIGTTTLQPGSGTTAPSRITGTVTGVGGAKVDDVGVDLFKKDGDYWEWMAETYSDSKGAFRFSTFYDDDIEESVPLPAGTYTLRFRDYGGDYKTTFLGGIASDNWTPPSGVGTIVLGADGSKVADITLAKAPVDRGSGAYGAVTNDLNQARRGSVRVYDIYGNEVEQARTHRDGTWELPATELAPGSYKVAAENDTDVDGWYGGGKSYNSAATYKVPVKGAVNLGNSRQARYATITGKITIPAVPGRDSASGYVVLRTANGGQEDNTYLGSNGTFTVQAQPGTYYLSAAGERWDSYDQSNLQISGVPFIEQFWKGAFNLRNATPIKVGSGAKVTGINMTLGRSLRATGLPAISGKAKKGVTLKASAGAWNVSDDVAFTYTWKRGSTVVGKGTSYKVAKADQGKTLSVTVTAKDTTATFAAGSATSKGVTVPKAKKKKKKKK